MPSLIFEYLNQKQAYSFEYILHLVNNLQKQHTTP